MMYIFVNLVLYFGCLFNMFLQGLWLAAVSPVPWRGLQSEFCCPCSCVKSQTRLLCVSVFAACWACLETGRDDVVSSSLGVAGPDGMGLGGGKMTRATGTPGIPEQEDEDDDFRPGSGLPAEGIAPEQIGQMLGMLVDLFGARNRRYDNRGYRGQIRRQLRFKLKQWNILQPTWLDDHGEK